MKYIDADKLIAKIQPFYEEAKNKARYAGQTGTTYDCVKWDKAVSIYKSILYMVTSLQQAQPNNMIQWTGNNLKEVIDFTGKSPRFGEWFKSWHEYENYVHTHNDILKLFCEDGSHYEVPVGAWIVKTPDGYNLPSVAKYIQQGQPEVDYNKFEELFYDFCERNKGHHITSHDACMWFWKLGLNARKEE